MISFGDSLHVFTTAPDNTRGKGSDITGMVQTKTNKTQPCRRRQRPQPTKQHAVAV